MELKIGIVEDDIEFANTLSEVINAIDNFNIEIVCNSMRDTFENIERFGLDVLILDIQLQDGTGIEILKKLKQLYPNTLYIMCTSFEDSDKIYESIKNGAVGYILKHDALNVIIHSIREAVSGGAAITPAIARKVIGFFQNEDNSSDRTDSLTMKETTILKLLSKGYLYKEIADIENNSIETVKKHIGNIYRKLGVSNKTEAANIYLNKPNINL